MKTRAAMLWDTGRDWEIAELDLDEPKQGEVLIRWVAAGLCHSDEHLRHGDIVPRFPIVGGHEGAGVIEKCGPGVSRVKEGDHVVTSFLPVCGHCRWCASGMEYLCDEGAGTMESGMPTDRTFRHHTVDGKPLGHLSKVGAFAKHTVVSQHSIVKIEPHLPLLPSALLSCAIPTGYGSAVNRANVRGGDTVVVIGAGGIGTAAIQGARINGAAQIVAVDPVEFKQKAALTFGATHSVATVAEATDLVRDLTYGVMADSVVVAPSLIAGDDVNSYLQLTRKGGTCVLTGMTAQTTRSAKIALQDFILWNKNLVGTVFGSCNPRADIARLARLYQTGQLQLDEMITKRYRLDDINDAYDDLRNGKLIRGVIDFGLG